VKRLLVIAPHPDDEVLGVGGTMARYAEAGAEVSVLIITKTYPHLFVEQHDIRVREETKAAHAILGITNTLYLEFPAAELDKVAHREMNAEVGRIVRELRPDALFLPFTGDIHQDHQSVFNSALVAARPIDDCPVKRIYAYETLSETNWNAPYLTPGFLPNVFVEITGQLERKLQAMQAYASQVKAPPHERSVEALRALATLRGATVSLPAAEAFVLVRDIL
jgi:N-acetylglucosamine malate deacetylase 1